MFLEINEEDEGRILLNLDKLISIACLEYRGYEPDSYKVCYECSKKYLAESFDTEKEAMDRYEEVKSIIAIGNTLYGTFPVQAIPTKLHEELNK